MSNEIWIVIISAIIGPILVSLVPKMLRRIFSRWWRLPEEDVKYGDNLLDMLNKTTADFKAYRTSSEERMEALEKEVYMLKNSRPPIRATMDIDPNTLAVIHAEVTLAPLPTIK